MVKMKRGLALLLALMMLLGMMSISAMAFEGFDEETSEIPAGEEVMEAVEVNAVEIAEIPVVAPVAVPAAAGEKAAAVDKSKMPANVKVIGWVSSDLNKGGTTIVKGTVFDSYNAELVIPKGDAKVNPGNAQIGVAMQNVSSLGVTDPREHHINITTGAVDSTDKPMGDIPLEATLNGFFNGADNNKLFAFTGAKVNATINGKAVTYTLADKPDDNAKIITATTTVKADAQAAWQEIAGAVKSSSQVNEDSYILVKGGSWLQLGGEVLCFEKAGDLKVDGQDENLVANIKKMVTVMDAKDPSKVAFALKKGTQLAVGATVAELTKDVVVSATVTNAKKQDEIDAEIAGLNVLSTMRAAANTSDIGAAEIIKTLLGFMNTAIGLVDGNVMNVTVETVAAAPEAPVKYHIGAGEKFKVWVSSDLNAGGKTTVTGTVFDNYNAELVLPKANVNPSNVTVGIAMQNVGSLNVTDPREYSISIETGLKDSGGKPIDVDVSLEDALNGLTYDGLFKFTGGTIVANINNKTVTYTLANKPDNNAKIITATPTAKADAQAAWQEMTKYVSAGTKAEDSFIVIPNGSWLQLGKQVLCFEDAGNDVTVDNIASLDVAGIKSKVQVVPAYDSKVAFVLKKGARLAVGSSIAELKEDVYVTVTPNADKSGVVDGLQVLSEIRDAANGGSFDARSLVLKLLECMDKAVKLIDGNEITVKMTFAADAPKAPVALTVKVLADKNLYTVGATGIVFNDALQLKQDDNGIYQVGVQVEAPKGITARIWNGDAWDAYNDEILYTAITPKDIGEDTFVTKAWEFDVDGDGKVDQTVQVSLNPDTKLSLAKVGDTQYFDLTKAVAVANGSEITLLRDVTAYEVAALDGVKVNFNGKTINGKGGDNLTACRSKDGDVYTLYTAHYYDMKNPVADTATCEKDGLLTYKCVRCGHQDGTYGHNKLDHAMVAVTGQPASAASAGWIDHWRCTRVCCKDKFFVMGKGGAYVEAAWSQIELTYTAPSNPPTPPTPSTPAEPEAPAEVEDLDEEEVPLSELPLPFVDVAATDWSREAIAFVYSNDLMVGMGATSEGVVFAPKTGLNRGGIVTLLYNLEKNPAIVTNANFVDVAAGQWYSDAVAWGVEAGLVNGYNDGTFGALDICTREQMFTLFYRYAMKKGLVDVFVKGDLTQFSDADAISGYAVEALEWAVGTGLVKGYNDGTLGPKNTITREQMAMFMLNFCETFLKNEDGKIVL